MKSAVSKDQIKELSVRATVKSRSVFEVEVVGAWVFKLPKKICY